MIAFQTQIQLMIEGIWFIFLGLIVGTMVGLTGLGGGSLMTPLLILSGLPVAVAIGTDIVYAAITKTFASLIHIKEKNVEFKVVGVLLAGSVPGLLVGYYFSVNILSNFGQEGLNFIMKTILSIILISLSLISIISEITKKVGENVYEPPDEIEEFSTIWEEKDEEVFLRNLFTHRQTYLLIFGAFAVGILVQITSVGSGVLITILLLNVLSPKKVVGTELVHAAILVGLSTVLYFNLGFIDYGVLWKILLGAVFGILIGVNFAKKVPKEQLKMILLSVILFAGIIILIG